MLINEKRALAYTTTITSIEPIPGYDKVEYASILGWHVIVSKDYQFKVGDKCIYFEIDSRVPESNPEFAFLAKRNFKIKTIKMCGVVSQGLIMPLSSFPNLDKNIDTNVDVTDILGVTYAVAEDNVRKSDMDTQRMKSYQVEHIKFFNLKLVKILMKYKWFRKLIQNHVNKKRSKKSQFPCFISKTDEERVQNMPWILKNKTPFVVTEKLDGTSTTFTLERKGLKFNVFSRNMNVSEESKNCYNNNNANIYTEMSQKYNIEAFLQKYLKENKNVSWVAIQGESFGEGWQGNPLKIKGHDFRAFNFIDSINGRFGSIEAKEILEKEGIPFVPIINSNYILPDSVDELIEAATGPAALNPDVLREGWVIRSLDGKTSFKAVSTKYLLSKGE